MCTDTHVQMYKNPCIQLLYTPKDFCSTKIGKPQNKALESLNSLAVNGLDHLKNINRHHLSIQWKTKLLDDRCFQITAYCVQVTCKTLKHLVNVLKKAKFI